MGSNGKHRESKAVQVFVARHESKNFTKIVVTDANGQHTIVEMMIPDSVLFSQVSAFTEGGNVLKSLRALLETCFSAVIVSMTNIIEGK